MSVFFGPNDYENNQKVFGRTSANHSLLKALMLYSKRTHISLYVEKIKFFEEFKQVYFKPTVGKSTQPIVYGDIPALKQSGLYLQTDPMLSRMSWARSVLSHAAFSLCGLTHSVSDLPFAEEIAKLILSPMRDWDALVCTSTAVKKAVENMFSQWCDHLELQLHRSQKPALQLPVIPLGIHPDEVATTGETRKLLRKKFRERYGINDNDYVVLFFGRLFFYEKAHPIPSYFALEALAHRIGSKGRVHLVQAGWFNDPEDLRHYKEAAQLFCPSINSIFINNIDTVDKKLSIWPGADVFISLSDNFQESFGITPLEAMANQLPVIVSDWDGYKDTVRHEIDGFRIPTLIPPAGCGIDLSLGYLTRAISYPTFSGLNAQMTAIDLSRCVDALWELYKSPELRLKMGNAGYDRVHERFHWQQVMLTYDALWDDLALRRHAASNAAKKPISLPPLLADPYLTFNDYASINLRANHALSPGNTKASQLDVLSSNYLGNFGAQQRLPFIYLEKIIQEVTNNTKTVQQMVELITAIDSHISSGVIVRSLTYLIKYDFIRISEF